MRRKSLENFKPKPLNDLAPIPLYFALMCDGFGPKFPTECPRRRQPLPKDSGPAFLEKWNEISFSNVRTGRNGDSQLGRREPDGG